MGRFTSCEVHLSRSPDAATDGTTLVPEKTLAFARFGILNRREIHTLFRK